MISIIILRSGWSGEFCDQEQEHNCEDGVDNDGGEIIIIIIIIIIIYYNISNILTLDDKHLLFSS